jgi:methionyl-tRNA formyltransferase
MSSADLVHQVLRVLVVSDNADFCKWLAKELQRPDLPTNTHVEWAYSSSNQRPDNLVSLGARPIDFGDATSVSGVISDFDLVLSIHCKQVFPATLVESVTCINLHPGFNPYNRGWYPQVFSIVNGFPVGATLHVMDAQIDHGPIIDQIEVQINPGDTSLEVYQRVLEAEQNLLSENLDSLLRFSFESYLPTGEGNYNSKADFRALCALDLASTATLREHIDLLRALSHGDYMNAFFMEGSRRYFVRIVIERDTN